MNIKKAVIPVAGKGTRFLPATKEIPKEMIPIVNKPMIQYVVEEAVASGIEEIVFVTSTGKQTIENYFDRNFELEGFLDKNEKFEELNLCKHIGDMIKIVAVRQKEQLGLGHAILCAKDVVGTENFAVLLGDDLVWSKEPVTKQLIEVSNRNYNSCVIGVMEVNKNDTDKYGIVDGEYMAEDDKTLKMKSMVEKPNPSEAPTNLATPGRYILTPEIFTALEKIPRGVGGEYQLTDAINLLARKEDVFAHVFEGDRFDTGNIPSYLNAVVEFSLRFPETEKIMKDIIRDKVEKYNIR